KNIKLPMLQMLPTCKKCSPGFSTGLAGQTDDMHCVVPNVSGCTTSPLLLMRLQPRFHMLLAPHWAQMVYISALTNMVVGRLLSTPGNCMPTRRFLGCR